jgi:hypothetical protein
MRWQMEKDLVDLKLMIAFHELLVAVDKAIRMGGPFNVSRGRGKPMETRTVLREEDFVDLKRAYLHLRNLMTE